MKINGRNPALRQYMDEGLTIAPLHTTPAQVIKSNEPSQKKFILKNKKDKSVTLKSSRSYNKNNLILYFISLIRSMNPHVKAQLQKFSYQEQLENLGSPQDVQVLYQLAQALTILNKIHRLEIAANTFVTEPTDFTVALQLMQWKLQPESALGHTELTILNIVKKEFPEKKFTTKKMAAASGYSARHLNRILNNLCFHNLITYQGCRKNNRAVYRLK